MGNPLYHQLSDEIFTISEFLAEEECARFIALAEEQGFHEAPINTLLGPQVHSDVRNNTRVILDDERLAQSLFERARDFLPANLAIWHLLGFNERFRFYRYDPGQQFNWHRDGAYSRANGEMSQLTFMIYLNDDFDEGETAFDECVVKPEAGMALCFVHQIPHAGRRVASGRKYVMRTDVMYGVGQHLPS